MQQRPYVARQLLTRATHAGFQVMLSGSALCFLFPPALGRLPKPQARMDRPAGAQLKSVPPWLDAALVRFQRLETRLLRLVRLPWRLSVVALLQKPVLQPVDLERRQL